PCAQTYRLLALLINYSLLQRLSRTETGARQLSTVSCAQHASRSYVKLSPPFHSFIVFPFFFFSSRRRHTRFDCDWSSDVVLFRSINGLIAKHPKLFPTAVEPSELRATAHRAGQINQDTILRNGEYSVGHGWYGLHLFGDWKSIPRRFQAVGVERLSHQSPLAQEEQIPFGIGY